jgi:hypothetical protein
MVENQNGVECFINDIHIIDEQTERYQYEIKLTIDHGLIIDIMSLNYDQGVEGLEGLIGKLVLNNIIKNDVYERSKVILQNPNLFKQLPKYVELEKTGTALRLIDNVYFRDMGGWSIGYKIENGQLYASVEEDKLCYHFNNQKLIEITEEEWKKDNSWHL